MIVSSERILKIPNKTMEKSPFPDVCGGLVLESFVQLEEREVRLDVERAENALSDELADLMRSVRDYGNYDRMYAYMVN
jgi:hypothetical protein